MKEFIGHKTSFVVEVIGKITGQVVGDTQSFILLKGKDEKIARLVKSKIITFVPIDAEPEYQPLTVIGCTNAKTHCRGVRMVVDANPVTKNDYERFMCECPRRDDDCDAGSNGDIRCCRTKDLLNMLDGVLFGEYPKEDER